MAKILVSNCLLGFPCRYKGDRCKNAKVLELANGNTLIGVCPEQMGGLSTPRNPAEIVGNSVISCTGIDVTEQYNRGAKQALELALMNNVDYAVLKSKSPSCGKGIIYDGTHTGKLIEGDGVTVRLLKENGIPVYTEEEIPSK